MDKEELFNLRIGDCELFDNPVKLEEFVRSVVDNPLEIPIVVGYNGHQDYWELRTLSPLTESDGLTARNFFGGLKVLGEKYKKHKNKFKKFCGYFGYSGIDTGNGNEIGSSIIHLALSNNEFTEPREGSQYCLDVLFGLGDNPRDFRYNAKSYVNKTITDYVMENYLGPCGKS